jgi:hypothetical protein
MEKDFQLMKFLKESPYAHVGVGFLLGGLMVYFWKKK